MFNDLNISAIYKAQCVQNNGVRIVKCRLPTDAMRVKGDARWILLGVKTGHPWLHPRGAIDGVYMRAERAELIIPELEMDHSDDVNIWVAAHQFVEPPKIVKRFAIKRPVRYFVIVPVILHD